ncbi:hypothetical protein LR48_Vigan05g000100 [Vigna angularis]|uniref:PB1-like domain-containing protein n=1 Tax=Phaseolus angularis TaxID=3914 RepID=A0A0L9UIK5_PHAAN|nr:hypothetical protein LR48_Vigan05g000100 [Vigna angularis]
MRAITHVLKPLKPVVDERPLSGRASLDERPLLPDWAFASLDERPLPPDWAFASLDERPLLPDWAFASLDERPLLPDWAFASLDERPDWAFASLDERPLNVLASTGRALSIARPLRGRSSTTARPQFKVDVRKTVESRLTFRECAVVVVLIGVVGPSSVAIRSGQVYKYLYIVFCIMDEDIEVVFHHGGKLVNDGKLKYEGGETSRFMFDPDVWSYFVIVSVVKSLGYDGLKDMWYSVGGASILDDKLERLCDDTGAMHMVNLARLNGEVHVFLIHPVSEPEVIHMLEHVGNDHPSCSPHKHCFFPPSWGAKTSFPTTKTPGPA